MKKYSLEKEKREIFLLCVLISLWNRILGIDIWYFPNSIQLMLINHVYLEMPL